MKSRPLYNFLWFIARVVRRVCGWQVIGRENIPDHRNVVIVSNHVSNYDPIMVATAFPYPIRFLAKEEFSHNSFLQWFFSALGVVFLKRNEADLTALRKALQVLKEGETIGIFAEGQRNFDAQVSAFKEGASFIAYKAGATLVPVALIRSRDLLKFWRRQKKVVIGQPLVIEKGEGRLQETLAQSTQLLQEQVSRLLEKNQ